MYNCSFVQLSLCVIRSAVMDFLRMRQYTGMQPTTKSSGLRGGLDAGGTSAKPLSKLDNARLKLSKYKLKYGKQEKQIHDDLSLSSIDLSLSEASPTVDSLPVPETKQPSEEPSEHLNLVENTNVLKSENINSDFLIKSTSTELYLVDSEHKHLPEAGLLSEKKIQSLNINTDSDSSVSEIHENIRSFSSLEIENRTQDVSSKSIQDSVISGNADVSLKSVQDSVISDNADVSLKSVQDSVISDNDVSLKSVQDGVISDNAVSLKSVQDGVTSSDFALPAHILERKTSITSVSSPTNTRESQQKVGQTVQRQIERVAAVQETSTSGSSVAESEQTTSRSEHSSNKLPDRVSSLSLVSLEKKPKQRDVKVQTERKRSRTVQVSLSDASYEERIRLTCPVLRASSLPRGLRSSEEPSDYIAEDTENAMQLLLKSQVMLTLNLLRREQALYVNCSRSAARLERGYQRHTLSDTRQFIRRERKLREKLRRNAE